MYRLILVVSMSVLLAGCLATVARIGAGVAAAAADSPATPSHH